MLFLYCLHFRLKQFNQALIDIILCSLQKMITVCGANISGGVACAVYCAVSVIYIGCIIRTIDQIFTHAAVTGADSWGRPPIFTKKSGNCLLYTSDAADEL